MKHLGTALVAVIIAIACGPASRPPEGPGTEWPCGHWGVQCLNGACCPWAHICGGPNAAGFQRCEPGYCCFDGDPMYGADRDGGPSGKPMPQYRPGAKSQ